MHIALINTNTNFFKSLTKAERILVNKIEEEFNVVVRKLPKHIIRRNTHKLNKLKREVLTPGEVVHVDYVLVKGGEYPNIDSFRSACVSMGKLLKSLCNIYGKDKRTIKNHGVLKLVGKEIDRSGKYFKGSEDIDITILKQKVEDYVSINVATSDTYVTREHAELLVGYLNKTALKGKYIVRVTTENSRYETFYLYENLK